MKHPPWLLAAAVAGSVAAAYLEAGRSCQLRWGATGGDPIRLAADVGLDVAIAEPRRALVIRGGIPMGPVPCPYDFTWGWVLREAQDGTTRLVVRERYAYTRRWAPFLLEPVQLISFAMTRRMLRGIKKRAERSAPSK